MLADAKHIGVDNHTNITLAARCSAFGRDPPLDAPRRLSGMNTVADKAMESRTRYPYSTSRDDKLATTRAAAEALFSVKSTIAETQQPVEVRRRPRVLRAQSGPQ